MCLFAVETDATGFPPAVGCAMDVISPADVGVVGASDHPESQHSDVITPLHRLYTKDVHLLLNPLIT